MCRVRLWALIARDKAAGPAALQIGKAAPTLPVSGQKSTRWRPLCHGRGVSPGKHLGARRAAFVGSTLASLGLQRAWLRSNQARRLIGRSYGRRAAPWRAFPRPIAQVALFRCLPGVSLGKHLAAPQTGRTRTSPPSRGGATRYGRSSKRRDAALLRNSLKDLPGATLPFPQGNTCLAARHLRYALRYNPRLGDLVAPCPSLNLPTGCVPGTAARF